MTEKVKTLSSPGSDIQLMISILKCSSLISIPMEGEVSEPNGLTRHELRVLICLSGEGVLTGQEISELMSMPAMNVSRALSNLHDKGWLELVDDGGNRRRRPFRISAKGWRHYNTLLPYFRSVSSRLFATLSKKDRIELQRLVNLMNDRLDHWGENEDAEAKEG
ncbi:MAG: winged helix-turn-helix transcriptional regulator [Oricola sp.]|nr:winged helix-turn-helix transcriptional regulator [Oricola sp.]